MLKITYRTIRYAQIDPKHEKASINSVLSLWYCESMRVYEALADMIISGIEGEPKFQCSPLFRGLNFSSQVLHGCGDTYHPKH